MHILLAASADSQWTKKYIENVLLPEGHKVTVLSTQNSKFTKFYHENDIQVHTISLNTTKKLSHVLPLNSKKNIRCTYDTVKRLFPNWLKKFVHGMLCQKAVARSAKHIPTYDALHIHYVTTGLENLYAPLLEGFRGKVVLTYWGSDLLRNTTQVCNEGLLKKASAIVFVTEGLKEYFHSIYGSKYDAKTHVIDFGVSVYDVLDSIAQNEHEENRQLFSIPKTKISIMVGYNASPGQQHLEIINALDKLPEITKSNIHVLLQYSYNYTQDESYYKQISQRLKALSFSWSIIDEYLNDEDTAKLRDSVDIFIHAQITDALSASMLEYLYAGTIVLNASWLKYYELETRGIQYLQFDSFEQLSSIVEGLISNQNFDKRNIKVNRTTLRALNSWTAVKAKWLNLYTEQRKDS